MMRHIALYLLVAITVLYSYRNSLSNNFAFDDHLAIVNNRDIHNEVNFESSVWRNDIWGKDLRMVDSHKSYRPLLIVSFHWLVSAGGSNTPVAWVFRMANIVSHAVVSCLVYHLGLLITADFSISAAAALLFASHPIHVEAVSAVVNMSEVVSAAFILISYLIYSSHCKLFLKDHTSSNVGVYGVTIYSIIYVGLWLLSVVLGTLYKETGLLSAVLLLCIAVADSAIEIFLYITTAPIAVTKLRGNQVYRFTRRICWIILSLLTIFLYFVFRHFLIEYNPSRFTDWRSLISFIYDDFRDPYQCVARSYLGNSQLIRRAENAYAFLIGSEKALSLMYLHFRYFYLLVFPLEQSPEYAFDCIPKISEWGDPRNVYSFGLYIGIVITGIVGLFQLYYSEHNRQSQLQTHPSVHSTDKPECESLESKQGSDSCTSIINSPVKSHQADNTSLVDNYDNEQENMIESRHETGINLVQSSTSGDAILISEKTPTTLLSLSPSSGSEVSVQSLSEHSIPGIHENSTTHNNSFSSIPVVTSSPLLNKDSITSTTDENIIIKTVNDTDKSDNISNKPNNLAGDAILQSLLWLVVPFVPVSGVFLRLGTLLAERLLYVPSIGYCLLLALLLWYIDGIVSWIVAIIYVRIQRLLTPTKTKNQHQQQFTEKAEQDIPTHDEDNQVIASTVIEKKENDLYLSHSKSASYFNSHSPRYPVLFWVAVVVIVAMYCTRTRQYNTVWANDDTLFMESLKVCSRSAKMHLQVGKIYMNRQQFKRARKHIQTAKKIDPDFCDIGYQEALLSISLDNDMDAALAHALRNLNCIFSSKNSFELIHKLWELQLNTAVDHGMVGKSSYHMNINSGNRISENQQTKHGILATQAKQALQQGIGFLAAKRYMEAAMAAGETAVQSSEETIYRKAVREALTYSLRALRVVDWPDLPHISSVHSIYTNALQETDGSTSSALFKKVNEHNKNTDTDSSEFEQGNSIKSDLIKDKKGDDQKEEVVGVGELSQELRCYVYALSGILRVHLLARLVNETSATDRNDLIGSSKGKKNLISDRSDASLNKQKTFSLSTATQKLINDLNAARDLLHRAVTVECITDTSTTHTSSSSSVDMSSTASSDASMLHHRALALQYLSQLVLDTPSSTSNRNNKKLHTSSLPIASPNKTNALEKKSNNTSKGTEVDGLSVDTNNNNNKVNKKQKKNKTKSKHETANQKQQLSMNNEQSQNAEYDLDSMIERAEVFSLMYAEGKRKLTQQKQTSNNIATNKLSTGTKADHTKVMTDETAVGISGENLMNGIKTQNTGNSAKLFTIPSHYDDKSTEKELDELHAYRFNAARLNNLIGIHYFNKNKFQEASDYFMKSIQLFNRRSTLSSKTSKNPLESKKSTKSLSVGATTTPLLTGEDTLELHTVGCNALHWYTNSMAGVEGFYNDVYALLSVMYALRIKQQCAAYNIPAMIEDEKQALVQQQRSNKVTKERDTSTTQSDDDSLSILQAIEGYLARSGIRIPSRAPTSSPAVLS